MSCSCSLVSCTLQQRILERYQEEEKKRLEEGTPSESIMSSKLQSQSLLSLQKCMQSMDEVRDRVIPIGKSLNLDSPVKIYDAASPYVEILSNREKEVKIKDEDAYSCLQGLTIADEFYRGFCRIPPVATKDEVLHGYVRDQAYFNNATWDGVGFHFGRADPKVFTTLFNEDTIIHEVGHAAMHYFSELVYHGQSGALIESISDIFATTSKHQKNGTRANQENADWGFAKIVNMGNGQTAYFRSLSNPGNAFQNHHFLKSDNQIKDARQYVAERPTPKNDNGGVHKYAGIPSHAFYQAAIRLQGNIWEGISTIWYKAATTVEYDADFASFAHKTIEVAKSMNYKEPQIAEIQKAWHMVNVVPMSKEQRKTKGGWVVAVVIAGLFGTYLVHQHL